MIDMLTILKIKAYLSDEDHSFQSFTETLQALVRKLAIPIRMLIVI